MPLLSQQTIDRVRDLPITDVVAPHVKLKTKGHQPTGCCPFHDEKSASFTIRPSHGTFKCFGCGAAGNGVGFLMKLKRLDFPSAIVALAEQFNIEVEYEAETPEQAKDREERQTKRRALQEVLDFAAAHYQAFELPDRWLKSRGWSEETAGAFGLGYADKAPRSFLEAATTAGFSLEALASADLIKHHGGQYVDRFVDRVIFPIRDVRGHVVSFTGRLATTPAKDDPKPAPKYDNLGAKVWTKGDHLYNLDRALRAIAATGIAYLVEGQPNVLRFQEVGRANCVARGGTAFTDAQAALLKKFAKVVVIVPDADKAGLKSMHEDVAPKLLALGLTVKVLLPDEGKDPDEQLLRKTPDDVEAWFRGTEDYVSGRLLKECQGLGEGDPAERAQQIERMRQTLELIVDDTMRQCYYSDVSKTWKEFAKAHKFKKRAGDLDLAKIDRLEQEQKADAFDYGFYEKGGRYYNNDGGALCNWTMTAHFFVRSETDPRYVISLRRFPDNRMRTMSISTDDISTTGNFKKAIHKLGGFYWAGSEIDLINMKMKLLRTVPEATSPQVMGWNRGGNFYTWANGLLYHGDFIQPDRYGVVKLRRPLRTLEEFRRLQVESQVLFGEKEVLVDNPEEALEQLGAEAVAAAIEQGTVAMYSYHYLPFASVLKIGGDDEDDDGFENQRRYKHVASGKITFEYWAQLVTRGFGDNGIVMVAYLVAALFRDIVFEGNDNYFPILNLFGQRGTGKSKAAEALAAMFGDYPPDGINVSSGTTPVGMQRYMTSAANALYWFNEFKNLATDKRIVEQLKGIADGSGNTKGRATGGNETRTVKPKSAAMLAGQDMPTIDVALLSRCIVLEFTQALIGCNDRVAYHELGELRNAKELTSVTCEILRHRDLLKPYRQVSRELRGRIEQAFRKAISPTEFDNEDRLIKNLASLIGPMQLLAEVLKFPFTSEQLLNVLVERVRFQVNVLKTEDDIGTFFSVLMAEAGRTFREGEHYRIVKESDDVTKLLLRFRAAHGVYLSAARSMGINGLGEAVIKSYLKNHPFYLEERQKHVNIGPEYPECSASVLNYDKMRAQEIEFRVGTFNPKMAGADDPSRELTRKVHLNGNAPDLIYQFVERLTPGRSRNLAQLLDDFNANKEPAMAMGDFIEQLKNYLIIVKRGRDLTFDDEYTKVQVADYCPI